MLSFLSIMTVLMLLNLKLIASVIFNVPAAVASILNASFFFPHLSLVIPNRKQKLVKTTTQIIARHTIRCLIDFTNQSPKVLYALSLSLSSCHWSRNLRMHTSCYLLFCFFTHLQGFLSHNQTEHEHKLPCHRRALNCFQSSVIQRNERARNMQKVTKALLLR
jgi:hypothetical protein